MKNSHWSLGRHTCESVKRLASNLDNSQRKIFPGTTSHSSHNAFSDLYPLFEFNPPNVLVIVLHPNYPKLISLVLAVRWNFRRFDQVRFIKVPPLSLCHQDCRTRKEKTNRSNSQPWKDVSPRNYKIWMQPRSTEGGSCSLQILRIHSVVDGRSLQHIPKMYSCLKIGLIVISWHL